MSACGLSIPVCHGGLVALSLVSLITTSQIRELVPESQAYMDLLAFERKLDQTIMRKRLDIQEALKRPIKVGSHPRNPSAAAAVRRRCRICGNNSCSRFDRCETVSLRDGCVCFHFAIKKSEKSERPPRHLLCLGAVCSRLLLPPRRFVLNWVSVERWRLTSSYWCLSAPQSNFIAVLPQKRVCLWRCGGLFLFLPCKLGVSQNLTGRDDLQQEVPPSCFSGCADTLMKWAAARWRGDFLTFRSKRENWGSSYQTLSTPQSRMLRMERALLHHGSCVLKGACWKMWAPFQNGFNLLLKCKRQRCCGLMSQLNWKKKSYYTE